MIAGCKSAQRLVRAAARPWIPLLLLALWQVACADHIGRVIHAPLVDAGVDAALGSAPDTRAEAAMGTQPDLLPDGPRPPDARSSDGATREAGPTVTERVKCGFGGATQTESCSSDKGGCSASESCWFFVSGPLGERVVWTSTCGGNVVTIVDGVDDFVVFDCR